MQYFFLYQLNLAPYDIKVGIRCEDPVGVLRKFADNLEDAKENCKNDKECRMFYSNCGATNDFRKCLTPAMVIKSTCFTTTNPTWEGKDILYVKGN